MELEDLKNIWQQSGRFDPKREEEIISMLKGGSRSIVSKLKRNVWIELLITLAAGMLLLYYSFSIPNGAFRWATISFLVLFIGYLVYYLKKLSVLNKFQGSAGNIKANLEALIRDLDNYLKFYSFSYRVLYPLYVVLIVLFLIADRGWSYFFRSFDDWKTVLYVIFMIGIFLFSSLWFTNWYLNKLYGRHLTKLKALLRDLEDESQS